MLGLLIRDKLNLEHFCGAPFVLSSCGHCYKEGEHPNIYLSDYNTTYIHIYIYKYVYIYIYLLLYIGKWIHQLLYVHLCVLFFLHVPRRKKGWRQSNRLPTVRYIQRRLVKSMETLKWGALQGSPWPSKFWGCLKRFSPWTDGPISPYHWYPGFILMLKIWGDRFLVDISDIWYDDWWEGIVGKPIYFMGNITIHDQKITIN